MKYLCTVSIRSSINRLLFSAVIAEFITITSPAMADGTSRLTMDCVIEAARTFDHDIQDLWTILAVENGRVGQCSSNRNGSVDCGPFQINSTHFPELARLFKATTEVVHDRLRDDACFGAHVAALILRQKINSAHGDTIEGLGRYHSVTPAHKDRYQQQLAIRFSSLFGSRWQKPIEP